MDVYSPASPEESPASPKQSGELLFIEDRTPTVIPLETSRFNKNKQRPNFEVAADFVPFSGVKENAAEQTEKTDKTDSQDDEGKKIAAVDETSLDEDFLHIVEDRNPIVSGQSFASPKYLIDEKLLKLQFPNESPKTSRFFNPCFNCGNEGHAVRDCPKPRNNAEISRNRIEYMNTRGTPSRGTKRYHVEESQKYGHIVPGELSRNLRKALGLDKRELPSFIYKMRVLGYPPAWLEEARVAHSGIRVFSGDSKEETNPNAENEEKDTTESLDKYDALKICRWPGFNVPPPHDTYDDSQYWGVPPFSSSQSVDQMVHRLSGRMMMGGYKRKKLSLITPSDNSDQNESAESQDMEYEETPEGPELPADDCKFVPPLPSEALPPPPPADLPPEPSDEQNQNSDVVVEKTSLSELEEQKKLLLAELNDTKPNCGTPNSRVGQIKTVELGTPILKSVSPYARLPSAEKFSSNICDVINFENLPDSTGNYEKMSGIIKNVRVKLSEMNDDD